MIRKDYTVRVDQIHFLATLPGNASEHVRAALDDYIIKKNAEKSSRSSLSPSHTRKGVVSHG